MYFLSIPPKNFKLLKHTKIQNYSNILYATLCMHFLFYVYLSFVGVINLYFESKDIQIYINFKIHISHLTTTNTTLFSISQSTIARSIYMNDCITFKMGSLQHIGESNTSTICCMSFKL